MGIINVGVISAAYQAGETVDLASLQAKGMIDGNIGRLKVLASGTLDKPLTIKADAFSVQAVKMITLTGGQAIELKGE
jgi:large subunit ribosomal protein L15